MMRKHRKKEAELAGVLAVWKNAGPTSHDVVDVVRKVARMSQVGHTGTLDPAAEGLLLLCLGPYTKLAPYLTDTDKTYRGYFCLGIETDTDDSDGRIIAVTSQPLPSEDSIREAVKDFVGEIEQVPPRYSAVKREGKKLYELARAGKECEVPARRVHVYSFTVEAPEPCEIPPRLLEKTGSQALSDAAAKQKFVKVPFTVRVSSGTYVRSLARDLGRKLGCGAFLLSLERTAAGVFSAEDAIPMQKLRELTLEEIDERLKRGTEVLDPQKYPIFHLLPAYKSRIAQGQPLTNTMLEEMEAAGDVASGTVCAIADEVGGILAMMQAQRLEGLQRKNPYAGARIVGFRPLRIFPGGLR